MPNKKQLIVIGHQWPEPKSSAAGTRMMQLLELFLEMDFQITFACAALRSEWSFPLETLGISVEIIRLNDSSFDAWIKAKDPSVVLFDRFISEEQYGWRVAQQCPNAFRILDTEDLHFLRQARHQAVKDGVAGSPIDLMTTHAFREMASIYRSDLTLLVSSYECDLLRNTFRLDEKMMYHLPLWIANTAQLADPTLNTFEQRKDFCFIGNFLHAPNWDAVLQLKLHLWPLLKQAVPEASLRIYGAYPTQKVTDLHQPQDRFLVCGRAENALETLASHRVLLAPIRFGAGIKGKFLDAMQVGTPSVTTTIGAEAMTTSDVWSGSIAYDQDTFVTASARLYQQKPLWEQAQKAGWQLLQERFEADLIVPPFQSYLMQCLTQLTQRRQANFIGQMLQHHQFQSTKFMSLWIEEKGRV